MYILDVANIFFEQSEKFSLRSNNNILKQVQNDNESEVNIYEVLIRNALRTIAKFGFTQS